MRTATAHRWLVAGLLAAVVASAVVVPPLGSLSAQTAGFADVPDDAYYSAPVASLAERGVFAGTECNEGFCPAVEMDRKTMAVWVVRVLDGEDPETVSESRFDDVDASSFYAPFIERMAELEVTQGCGDGSGFCPDRNVTRAHMAAFLSRAYKLKLPEGPAPEFADVPEDVWYATEVAKLAASGITVGCGDGTNFCPDLDTTRGQMATFLYRAENRADQSGDSSDTETEMPVQAFAFSDVNAGVWHTCGVLASEAVTCWGYNDHGQSNAPAGTYRTASGGALHSCGLRTDGTVTCWGNNADGRADAPEGTFSSVSVGAAHTCGVRTDATIACWGLNTYEDGTRSAQSDAPEGTFSSVEAGVWHSCAVRTDGTVACWGNNYDGQSDPPEGAFSSVSAAWAHTCGVRTDATIACWGNDDQGPVRRPRGDLQFRQRRRPAFLRGAQRRHHHLLGSQRQR